MSLIERLDSLKPRIHELLKAAGGAGLSVGVVRQGKVLHESHYGVRSVSATQQPDGHTIYHMASLSKALTAAGIADLINQGKLSWDTRVAEIMPEWRQKNKQVETQTTVTDILAHRTGLSSKSNYQFQMEQELLVPVEAIFNVMSDIPTLADFRSTIKYNNWLYGLAGLIIERESGLSLDEYLRTRFFDPLRLTRTTFGPPSDSNRASAHCTLSDGTAYQIPSPECRSGNIKAGCAGMTSSLNDLLTMYNSLLHAYKDQQTTGLKSTPNSPWKDVESLFTPCNRKGSTEYGRGWLMTDLPGEIGWVGMNDGRVAKNPVIAQGISPTRLIYHNGSLPGFLSSVHLLPDSDTAVVVLCNTMASADVPDYVGAMIIETVLDAPQRNDFLPYVNEAVNVLARRFVDTAAELAAERKPNTSHRPLDEYTGRFVNKQGTFCLVVTKLNEKTLRMNVQGLPRTYYDLTHYHDDVFAWPCDRDAEAKRAMYPKTWATTRKLRFRSSDPSGGRIDEVSWAYVPYEPAGEVFHKG
jgi:CubicO group peptidase (beta-lactamase class C family)